MDGWLDGWMEAGGDRRFALPAGLAALAESPEMFDET
jgi:hypothetical protein